MNHESLITAVSGFFQNHPGNFVDDAIALSPEVAGMRIYDPPLFAFGAADDPLFADLGRQDAVGPHFMKPSQWLQGAVSVISFFLPFTEHVRRHNAADLGAVSLEWLHARIEGQAFVKELCAFLCDTLQKDGYRAVTPCDDPRFWSKTRETEVEDFGLVSYTSNWSERHVAYICGLGTFCLSKGLITEKGVAGRFGSVVTDCRFEMTRRGYIGLNDYCIQCGVCMRNCPASAISLTGGKDHEVCWDYLEPILQTYRPRYGCGKCQVATPCESRNPGRRRS